jgi:hypothetical protein
MQQDPPAGAAAPYADAVTVLATALDRLGARIHRDLHVDSTDSALGTDPQVTKLLVGFSAYADECLAALDDATVQAALAAAGTAAHQQSSASDLVVTLAG